MALQLARSYVAMWCAKRPPVIPLPWLLRPLKNGQLLWAPHLNLHEFLLRARRQPRRPQFYRAVPARK